MTVKIAEEKKSAPLEKDVQKKIVKWLRNAGFHVDVITKGMHGANGISDIIAVKRGRYFAFEVKRAPGMKGTKLQEAWLADVQRHGGIAKVVGSVDEVENIVNYYRAGGMI